MKEREQARGEEKVVGGLTMVKVLKTAIVCFYLGATLYNTQELLITVHSVITPRGFGGPDGILETESESATCKASDLPTI